MPYKPTGRPNGRPATRRPRQVINHHKQAIALDEQAAEQRRNPEILARKLEAKASWHREQAAELIAQDLARYQTNRKTES